MDLRVCGCLACDLSRRVWILGFPAGRRLSKRRFSTRCLPKAPLCVKCAKPCASDSLKETRDKDSSLAAALKSGFAKAGLFPILSKRPEIRIPSLAAALKSGGFGKAAPLPILSKRPEIRIPAWRQL